MYSSYKILHSLISLFLNTFLAFRIILTFFLFSFLFYLKFTLILIDPLHRPSPIRAWYSLSRASIFLLIWNLWILSFFPYPHIFIDTCWGEKISAWGEGNARNIMIMSFDCRFLASMQIIYSAIMSIWANNYSRGLTWSAINTPSWIVGIVTRDIIKFDWLFIKIVKKEHSSLAFKVYCHYKFIPIAIYEP